MKKISFISLVLSLVLLFVSCSFGITKIWDENAKTKVSINFGGSVLAPTNTANKANRALVSGSSFLYIIMLPENSTEAQCFGPYEVKAGTNFQTTEIPAGIYTNILLINSATKLSNEELKDQVTAEGDTISIDNSLFTQATSTAQLSNLTEIKSGKTTTLSATLIPLNSNEISLNNGT